MFLYIEPSESRCYYQVFISTIWAEYIRAASGFILNRCRLFYCISRGPRRCMHSRTEAFENKMRWQLRNWPFMMGFELMCIHGALSHRRAFLKISYMHLGLVKPGLPILPSILLGRSFCFSLTRRLYVSLTENWTTGYGIPYTDTLSTRIPTRHHTLHLI